MKIAYCTVKVTISARKVKSRGFQGGLITSI